MSWLLSNTVFVLYNLFNLIYKDVWIFLSNTALLVHLGEIDGVHLDEDGHKILSTLIEKEVTRILNKR